MTERNYILESMNIVTAGPGVDNREILERGDILLFPDGGYEISANIRTALMGATQDARSFHKNIAYKPNVDKVSGLKDRAQEAAIHPAMREYSKAALAFLSRILPGYARGWKVDYASFRSIEEKGRELPLNKRNDLLHVDAFPTRPVFGDMILRCFTNVNPSQSREWVTGDPFAQLGPALAKQAGLDSYLNPNGLVRAATRTLHGIGLPVVDRSPYDAFMLHFHDWLKGNAEYQKGCTKYQFSLPPGSTWLVFTDLVPHAVLSGRLALEQTVIVSRKTLKDPANAPSSILEQMTGKTLTV